MKTLNLFNSETQFFRTFLYCIKIAFTSSPEMMIISDNKMFCSNLSNQYILNKIACGNLAELLIEFYYNKMIDMCFFKKTIFSSIVVRKERLGLLCSSTSLGCGEKVMTTDSPFCSFAHLTR